MNKKKFLAIGLSVMMLSTTMIGCTNDEDVAETEPAQEQEVETQTPDDNMAEELYTVPNITEADDALEALKAGNKRFVDGEMENFDLGEDRRDALLTDGQEPHTIVIACSDSRVAPEHILDQGLGDLFVIRIAGNVLSEEEMGSIEYAVANLDSPLIVLMGHEDCGAVTAAVESTFDEDMESTENIDSILNRIQPAIEEVKSENEDIEKEDLVVKTIDKNIDLSLDVLAKNSDIVLNKAKEGNLKAIGANYSLETGMVEFGEFYNFQ